MAKREMKTVKTEEQIVEETVVETPKAEEELIEVKTSFGIVTGCSRLNVRKKPNEKADVIKVINANDKVMIFDDESTKDWYKVTVSGVEGFCMKRFITIK